MRSASTIRIMNQKLQVRDVWQLPQQSQPWPRADRRTAVRRRFAAAFIVAPQRRRAGGLGPCRTGLGYSIKPPGVGTQLQPFRNLIGRILSGEPGGNSTKDFSDKYAALSAELLSKLDETQPGGKPEGKDLAWTWIERNDAQNYVVLGDPAVRVRVDQLS
jgi:hypothetical protein